MKNKTKIIIVSVCICALILGIYFQFRAKDTSINFNNQAWAHLPVSYTWNVSSYNSTDVSISIFRLTSINPSEYTLVHMVATSTPNIASSTYSWSGKNERAALTVNQSHFQTMPGDILQFGCAGKPVDPSKECKASIEFMNYSEEI